MNQLPMHDYEIAAIVMDRMRRLAECDGWCKKRWISEFERMIELTGNITKLEGWVTPNKAYEARKASSK